MASIIRGAAPTPEMVEMIGYASLNPLFKKPKFRKALIDYRINGLRSKSRNETGLKAEMRYIKYRKRYHIPN